MELAQIEFSHNGFLLDLTPHETIRQGLCTLSTSTSEWEGNLSFAFFIFYVSYSLVPPQVFTKLQPSRKKHFGNDFGWEATAASHPFEGAPAFDTRVLPLHNLLGPGSCPWLQLLHCAKLTPASSQNPQRFCGNSDSVGMKASWEVLRGPGCSCLQNPCVPVFLRKLCCAIPLVEHKMTVGI